MKKLLFSFIVFFLAKSITASHLMGSDMHYICLGGGKYKIVATIYRDCRGIAFNNPTFGVYAGSNHGDGCGKMMLSISRTSITDVTPLCATATKTCYPANTGGTGQGVEKHIYETTVDFTKAPLDSFVGKASCCDVTFFVGQCCRNGAITTGPAGNEYYATCSINLCNVGSGCNSSPTFSNLPIFFACCNQPYVYNHGLMDTTDMDSMAFKLVPGLNSIPNTSVSYTNPFSYQFPLTPLCSTATIKCTPDPNADPPVGFYFNGRNADMIFTPTKCDEVAIVVVEVTEFRKIGGVMKEVGRTRRDMEVAVESCPDNMNPRISGHNQFCVKEGDTICFEMSTFDTLQSGQNVGDSVNLTWNGGIKGGKFTVLNPTDKNPTGRFCWIVPNGASRTFPYTFSVHAMDDNCPRRAEAYKGFSIYVGHCDTALSAHSFTRPVLAAYPVPVKPGEDLHLNLKLQGCFSYTLVDMQGRHVGHGEGIYGNTIRIPAQLAAGVYCLNTVSGGILSSTRIIVKE